MSAALAPKVDAFLAYLRVERRYSPSTIDHYGRALASLVEFAESRKLARWRDLRGDQVQALLAAEHRRGLAPASLKSIASAWRSFFRWLAREGDVAQNPALGLRSPRVTRKLPEVLDADEMATLVEVPGDDAEAVRDRALFELLYSSGLRVSELCGVRWRDLDAGDGLLRVTGKGSKTRIVPVGAKALAALAALREQDRLRRWRSARARTRRPPADAERRARAHQAPRAAAGRVEARLSAPDAPFVREPSARIVR